MEPPLLTIDRSRDPDGAVRVIVRGILDLATAQQLQAALEELRVQHQPVRLDLGAVEFMDSTGLGVIIGAKRDADADSWSFELDRRVSASARRLFNLAGIETYIWR